MGKPKYWDTLNLITVRTPTVEHDLRRMIFSPGGITKLWVLVEGEADPYFYERVFDRTRSTVIKVGKPDSRGTLHGGCKVVIELVGKMLSLRSSLLVIGIIDRDWRSFMKKKQSLPENIFLTDHRDLEMTCFSYKRLYRVLKTEFINCLDHKHLHRLCDERWDAVCGHLFDEVCEKCRVVSRYMGLFHIVAAYYGTSDVHFKASEYWDEPNRNLYRGWKETLFRKSLSCSNVSVAVMHRHILRIKICYLLALRSDFDVCRGHDYMSVLSNMLLDTKHFSERWLTYFLTQEINADEIRSMKLYRSISRWMRKRGVSLMAF